MQPGAVLLLEHEPQIQNAIRTLSRSIEAVCVRSVREAEALLASRFQWTALILDARVSDGSGLQVLASARASARWRAIPALVLADGSDDDSAQRAFELYALILQKPVSPTRLQPFLRTIERARHTTAVDAAIEAWIDRFRLTPAESDVLRRTARGESRSRIAEARGVAMETLKKQIASLLGKTGEVSLLEATAQLLRDALQR